jgi:hypothetical protein
MRIYLGFTGNKQVAEFMQKYNCGWLFSPTNYSKNFKGSFCMDNGCFSAHLNNKTWDENGFYKYVRDFVSYKPDFIVVPDIIAGGMKSLKFSLDYVESISRPRYLAVQDGMISNPVRLVLDKFDGIFVGGTIIWKMNTAKMWVDVAHLHGIKCHVGRIGTFQGYALCEAWGVDSVDGTNPSRNCNERPLRMFKEQSKLNNFDLMDIDLETDYRWKNLCE